MSDGEDPVYLYTEKSTSFIYEVKLFDDFVIVRPASPAFYDAIKKMDHISFVNEFEEFYGDREQVFAYLRNELEGTSTVQ